ncbi:MAG: hypothetical protein DRP63_02065 [Planctomycetota bacterium]|nr:MAG: hypothetical protein DRP63_02065 [Planctomycetota bacterium]
MEPPEEIREHLLRLGRLIERVLSRTEAIRKIVRQIEKKGYHISLGFVTMVSPIGSREKEEKPLTFELNDWDRRFLREIGIDFNEERSDDADD